jgi:hypothetical protein
MALKKAENGPFGVIFCLPRRVSYVTEGRAMNPLRLNNLGKITNLLKEGDLNERP